jgi:sigma-B regulation protein RsbU (phosphoserine phosphatase)
MQHSLTNYIEELKATTAEKVSIERDLQIAHGIQMALLPKTFPPFPNRTDIDLYGMLRPAKDVGGDLFDFFIRDEKLFFCIGDVSGKGVPASLVMAVTRTLFRNVSAHVTAPEKIVAAVNDSLAADNDSSMFVTLFVGVLDIAGGQLLYCNAGHDAPLLIGQGRVALLPCDPNLPTGIVDGHEYTQQQTMLQPGTTLFLYTDGLNEAEDSQHAQFGEERMMLLARQLLNEGTIEPKQLIDSMEAAVKTFVGQAEQSDDLTMMALLLR